MKKIVSRFALVGLACSLSGCFVLDYFRGEQLGKAKAHLTKASMLQLETTLELFKAQTGNYPEKLEELLSPPKGIAPFFTKLPTDGWNRGFRYQAPRTAEGTDFQITSAGPDGQFGNSDDIRREVLKG